MFLHAVMLLAAALAGCSRTSLDAWVTGEMTPLSADTPRSDDPLVYDGVRRTVRLFGGSNETLSFQVVVELTEEQRHALGQVRIEASDLKGPDGKSLSAERVRVFRMLPVTVTDYPAWYLRLAPRAPKPTQVYDALVPPDLVPLPTGDEPLPQRLAFWVDVNIPRGTWPGTYAGRLTLRGELRPAMDLPRELDWMHTRDLQNAKWETDVAVKVYDFVLPDARPIAAVGAFDYRDLFGQMLQVDGNPYRPTHVDPSQPMARRGLVLMRQLMRMAHRHRLDLFETALRPVLKRDPQGNPVLRWDDYDRIVKPYLDGSAFEPEDRVGTPAWPIPVSDAWPNPAYYGGSGSETYRKTFQAVGAASIRHFLTDLDAGEQAFAWPYRGKVDAEAFGIQANLARQIRQTKLETPILARTPFAPPEETGWKAAPDLPEMTDILAPGARWLYPHGLRPPTSPSRPLAGMWISPGQPPYLPSLGVVATGVDPRAFAWFASRYDARGILIPEVLGWDGDPFASADGTEARLFYPGSIVGAEQVFPSVRLKRLRRGLQDLAYLWILRQRKREGIASSVTNALAYYGGQLATGDNYLDVRLEGWAPEPEAWQSARRLMAEEIQAVVSPSPNAAADLPRIQSEWNNFLRLTRTVRLERFRSTIRSVMRRTEDGRVEKILQTTLLLDLYNELGRDAEVRLGVEGLPEGWTTAQESPVVKLAPRSRAVVSLLVEGDVVPARLEGKIPLKITVDPTRRPAATYEAALAVLRAGETTPRLRVDGDLREWPLRTGNVAGAFRLIGRLGKTASGLASRQTSVFTLADEKYLHFAFRCEEPKPGGMIARRTNFVRHEQLLACEEDLVEILLDPGADGEGPEDLYHVVVKPNGIITTTRGVATDPPLGVVRPWSSGAKVAVAQDSRGWVVELKIPRTAFGDQGGETFWGVNFARYRPQSLEASNWAECPRYYYHPRNLGTMVIP